MSVRIESPRGKLVYDIRTMGPAGPIRERRNAPDSIHTESALRRWAMTRERHLTVNGEEVERVEAPTLKEFGARWLKEYCHAEGLKPSTLDAYERILRLHLYPPIGTVKLDAIGELQLQRVKLHVAGKSEKTRACVLSVLAEVLRTAERWVVITKAPVIELPGYMQPKMEFYDFDDWERLVEGARAAGPMHYAAVLLAGEAGLRLGELVAFEQTDIGPLAIEVCRSEWRGKVGKPKGGKIRHIPMTERLRAALAAVRHLRGKRLLWQPRTGRRKSKHATKTTLQSWLETACSRAGLKRSRNWHRLRHTFCSHLAMRGAAPRAIQELAGHADLKTTQRYMHLSPASTDAAIALLEQRGAPQGSGRGASRG